jgi:ABC-type dipeptide/oligopeptide/nickel transport system ATPase component
MPYDIILGRDAGDKKKFGNDGLINLGKGYVTMGTYTSLSNTIMMDVARSHVVLVAGKRGSGKSYTIGVIAEELANLEGDTARNIASLIFDTMGIFWTMKFKNEKEQSLLTEWDLETKPLPVRVIVPYGKAHEYKEKNIPIDETFALNASELDIDDWLSTFNLTMTSQEGVTISNAVQYLKKQENTYTIEDIKKQVLKEAHASTEIKNTVVSLFQAAETWGIFSQTREGTNIIDLVKAGKTSVLDLSVYSSIGSFNVRALVIGLVSRKLFVQRMDARKKEEMQALQHGVDYLSYATTRELPLVWLFVDEAHEFLPREGKTPATEALVQILREGRQPGISLVLATQQPGQIHKDVMTQSDIVISHKVTSQQDVEALNQIMQTYLLETIRKKMDELPNLKGSAIILDDNSERLYSMRMRPRFTWHGGEAPSAIKTNLSIS